MIINILSYHIIINKLCKNIIKEKKIGDTPNILHQDPDQNQGIDITNEVIVLDPDLIKNILKNNIEDNMVIQIIIVNVDTKNNKNAIEMIIINKKIDHKNLQITRKIKMIVNIVLKINLISI
jgi:hypothetical protein